MRISRSSGLQVICCALLLTTGLSMQRAYAVDESMHAFIESNGEGADARLKLRDAPLGGARCVLDRIDDKPGAKDREHENHVEEPKHLPQPFIINGNAEGGHVKPVGRSRRADATPQFGGARPAIER